MRSGCPSGKVIHSSETEASFVMLCLWREAQGTGRKVPRRVYRCPRGCGGFHLTSMSQEDYNAKSPSST